jgi:hypothetical protein
MIIIKLILAITALYLLFGLLFAILFVIKGVEEVDESAHRGSIGFRIIIIPGVMAFWPLLMKKWIRSANQTHRD